MKRAVKLGGAALLLAGWGCGRSHPLGGGHGDAGGDVSALPPSSDAANEPGAAAPDASDDPISFPTTNGTGGISNAYKRAGGCVCQESTPTACTDACRDLQTDADNCGACGHKCVPTATCQRGVCDDAPIGVFTGAAKTCGGIDLAFGGGALYWAAKNDGVIECSGRRVTA